MKTFKQFLHEALIQSDSKNLSLNDRRASTLFKGSTSKNVIGSGQYAYVKDDKTDPHMVNKFQKRPTNNDPFWTYVQFIQNSDDALDNPYLPKIYSKVSATDKNDDTSNMVKMEKLYPLRNLSSAQALHLYHRAFGQDYADTYYGKQTVSRYKTETDEMIDELAGGAMSYLLYAIGEVINGEEKPQIFDDNDLKKALIIIERIRRKFRYRADIHDDNLMIRLSPHGPQLVITDPLWTNDAKDFTPNS